MPPKVMAVFGTRPEIIKMYPVIEALKASQLEVSTLTTAQHREMMDMFCDTFGITPDIDLNLMQSRQSLGDLTANIIQAVTPVLEKEQPDMVLVQGDTTTVMATALAASYYKIPVGHVEAGLRTPKLYDPFPEEINRRLVGRLAQLHFAPTPRAMDALLAENTPRDQIFCTGNTVIDAILSMSQKNPDYNVLDTLNLPHDTPFFLVTAHRRENWGEPLENICKALLALADECDHHFVFPVHKNPVVREVVYPLLGDHPRFHLEEPFDYVPLMDAIRRSFAVITDSGGIQEEAPALGKPVLVLRETTERPEGIEKGTAQLVGTDPNAILEAARALLHNPEHYQSMAQAVNPYGDGKAATRIVQAIEQFFGLPTTDLTEFSPDAST